MIQTGILEEDEPVELIHGWIVFKMPRNPPHDVAIDLGREALETRLPPEWRVRVQSAITTADSEPEPDLAVVRGPARRYLGQHPGPEDVALICEVADSSLDGDREVKGPLYAAAGIPVYWIINLVDLLIEVYTLPTATGYGHREDFAIPKALPLTVAGQVLSAVPVQDILG
jgi:Uma2 family endonuclease